MDPIDHLIIGKNIRKIRKKLGYTLDTLAKKSGVSQAMLSQIEGGKVNPTIATVWKIAQGLGVELNDFLNSSREVKKTFRYYRGDEIPTIDTRGEGSHLKVLSPIAYAQNLELYYLILDPNGRLHSSAHEKGTEELATIIKGSVRITAGENVKVLQSGDFIIYHCDVDHTIENVSDGTSELHIVVKFSDLR